MNRLLLLLLVFLSTSLSLESQILDPVQWSFNVVEKGAGEYDIVFHAEMEGKWHVYSQDLGEGKIGPIPTTFIFEPSKTYKLKGKVKEGKAIVEYDSNFEMELAFFEHSADFTQRISSSSSSPFNVKGVLEYMTCDDKQCIFPDPVEFDIQVIPQAKSANDTKSKDTGEIIKEPAVHDGEDQVQPGILDPVDWSWKAERIDEDEYFLVFTAVIDEHWHVYSAYLDTTKIGPVPTSVSLDKSKKYAAIGGLQEGKPVVKYDPNFDMDLKFFDTKADFVQRISWTGKKPGKVKGYVSFMTCNDEMCLPPEDVEFELDLSMASETSRSASLGLSDSASHGGESDDKSTSMGAKAGQSGADGDKAPVNQKSMWGIFIVAFFSGFAALLTPCVFPMIPLTVSFFTKQSKTRAKGISNAIFYGLSIIVLYVALGVGVSSIFGAGAMHELSTNTWFNLFFFFLLVVFAASFLGAFEITLPNSWVNKADSASNKGGMLGIFFMAFTLALVSFSCTGPIVGTLLVEAAQGGYMGPIIGMFGFSLAIALPFALFAAFPGWLNSLPQSGGWLNSVKVVLGFLELALAFKFLSNADLVEQWHLLEREAFIALWIIIFTMLTMYLLGFLKLSHDSPLPHINVTRIFMAVITGAFTLYMIPGLWGAPLKIINAFPPPMFYSESPEGVGFFGGRSGGGAAHDEAHAPGTHKGPAGIYVFHDYTEGLEYAKKEDLPVMLDFTGWACVNCRKMEENVWTDPSIKQILSDDVVLISLYVDERTPLPESEWYEKELNGKLKKIRRVGDKWKVMQEERYNINSQPYYVLMDHEENNIIEAANYQDHGSIPIFKEWLDRGLEEFNK
jgi:thiol:disulfide interchange protein DsbD